MVNRHLPGSTRRVTLGADKGYCHRALNTPQMWASKIP
jgi:hypothetical protein